MGRAVIDIRRKKYAKLTVMKFHSSSNSGAKWLCKCECGGSCIAYAAHLKRGATKSCGCLPKGLKYEG